MKGLGNEDVEPTSAALPQKGYPRRREAEQVITTLNTVEELGVLLARAQSASKPSLLKKAMGYASALLKDIHLAEVVAQDAFVEAYLQVDLSTSA